MNTVIFDVGNVLAGYDWESYLKTFRYPAEVYERVADAVFRNADWECAGLRDRDPGSVRGL